LKVKYRCPHTRDKWTRAAAYRDDEQLLSDVTDPADGTSRKNVRRILLAASSNHSSWKEGESSLMLRPPSSSITRTFARSIVPYMLHSTVMVYLSALFATPLRFGVAARSDAPRVGSVLGHSGIGRADGAVCRCR
jgi:hypothetical protein